MSLLLRGARALDRLASGAGQLLGWFTLAMALLQSAVVILRYVFHGGSVALQDAVIYLHGSAFMLGLAYALHAGAHVRVDVFYRRMGPRGKAWVNAVGTLVFLLPLCAFICVGSWQFAANSWAVLESSSSAGGLPGVFLLKSLIPLSALTLALAGLAEFARALTQLMHETTSTNPPPAPASIPSHNIEEASA
ncbi:TRAP transporter small permease subunit [Microbulbifer thermotolerans]|uniref:TRAP transporter small permease protein n=1 Tax=Microbulbifer thermotolerans TaxID=252514 RepID=A0AB35I137_MICTH|nr:TRAP transporter small permease subunit [Microbulbifer thermotolerans]MCX2794063.1 TRAP transporter small permease subunit [Microbulbifer thermotolerans]MCX2802958.1 TRAP transporter small permease subunit [Microbulbifer thermotolerans]MCX2840961.1 TRAP transporter small permease subunit [Microbulbifer thermotolerans]